MLYTLEGILVDKIPHNKDFIDFKSRLTDYEIEMIKMEILNRINDSEVNVSAWLPGHDWTNTPFQPIFEKACKKNYELSGKCFGLFVWETLMKHEDSWFFTKQATKDQHPECMIYFKSKG